QNDDIPNKLYVDNQNATKVGLSGDQSISGVKTFNGSVIVPNPTNSNHAGSKSYIDTADNLKANLANPTFTGTANIPTLNVTTAVT
ncbi:hypothetical protein, partial [Lactococcus petauri]|uniref:hypothetical protein n=1 Tax=Lactococcus petauri TaxID=1940789 RepID=UPI0021F15318